MVFAMNDIARILFQQFDEGVSSWTRSTGTKIRSLVDTSTLQPDQQRQLQEVIRSELRGLVWWVLGRFDNVGGSMPEEYTYRIMVTRDTGAQGLSDLSDDGMDYADMWQDFLLRTEQSQRDGPAV